MNTARPASPTSMLQLTCPWCGPREELEFRYGGAGVPIPSSATDAEWARVLYFRSTPAGAYVERWVHAYGCRQWFQVVRDTLTHAIAETTPLDASAVSGAEGTADVSP